MATFGYRVRQLRERKGWTQEELGVRAGTRYETINRIERGTREPRIKLLVGLAKALGTTTDYLCGMYEEESEDEPAYERIEVDGRMVRQYLLPTGSGA